MTRDIHRLVRRRPGLWTKRLRKCASYDRFFPGIEVLGTMM